MDLVASMPPWLPPFMKKVGECFNTEDPLQLQAWRHEDGGAWHIDIMPTIIEENAECYVRNFNFHLTALIGLLEGVDVVGDLNTLSVTGKYETNEIHIVMHLGPDGDDDDDEELPDLASTPKFEKATLPN